LLGSPVTAEDDSRRTMVGDCNCDVTISGDDGGSTAAESVDETDAGWLSQPVQNHRTQRIKTASSAGMEKNDRTMAKGPSISAAGNEATD